MFVKYGRSLKPDLILAQWNHLGDFGADQRRRALPAARASSGAGTRTTSGTAPAARRTSPTWQGRPRRRDACRPATSAARSTTSRSRSASTRGRASARRSPNWPPTAAPRWASTRGSTTPPPARRSSATTSSSDVTTPLYRANRPHAEVALLFPRSKVHRGDVAAVEAFRKIGQDLLDAHVLFDVWPDDAVLPGTRGPLRESRHRRRMHPTRSSRACRRAAAGSRPRARSGSPPAGPAGSEGEIDLHFVNYNRTELPPGPDGQPEPRRGHRGREADRRLRDRRRHPPARRGRPSAPSGS